VASAEFTLPEGFSGFANADFSSVTLTGGQQYTVLITAPDYDWVVFWNQVADDNGPIPGRMDYAGGRPSMKTVYPNRISLSVQPSEPATNLAAFDGCLLLFSPEPSVANMVPVAAAFTTGAGCPPQVQ
jgi:hypothetical protein